MKRFMKGCGIAALVLAVLGAALAIAGHLAADNAVISQVVDNVTGGRVHMDGIGGWNFTVGDGFFDDIFGVEVNYEIGDSSMFDKNYSVLNGDVAKYSLGGGVRDLVVEVGGCSFETKTSEDNSLYVEAGNVKKFQGYVEGDTLYVRATVSSLKLWGKSSDGKIILYVPENYSFDEVEIEMGAGVMEFDGLIAREVSVEVGAGQIKLENAQVQELDASVGAGQIALEDMVVGKLDVEVGMGEFTAEGTLNGDADIDCSMGNVQMKLTGSERDFNYELKGAMGNVEVGGNSYSGFAQERTVDNNAARSMKVDCSMGNITIEFTE